VARLSWIALVLSAGLFWGVGAAHAQTPEDPPRLSIEGHYLDGDEWVPFRSTFAARSDRYEPDYLRSTTWMAVLVAAGTTWYWAKADLNALDWDMPSLHDRLTFEAVRFDNNRWTTNNLLHPISGAGYYGMSRVSGLDVIGASLFAIVGSTIWEYAIEFREKVSVNDMVFTPVGGIPIGEFLFQLGEYLNSAPGGGSAAHHVAAMTLGLPRWLHDSIDPPDRQPPLVSRDALGLSSTFWHRFNGTMRVERHGAGATASGDLYSHQAYKFTRWPSYTIVPNPDPSPSAGIPIFRRSAYRYYLRVTQILEWFTVSNSFTMKFERHSFSAATGSWSNDGIYTAQMTFKPAPAGYPSGAIYLEGSVTDPSGTAAGTISMGWVSKYLRKATLEVDRVSQSEHPANNGSGVDWKDVYDAVDWDVNVYESDTNLSEPSGQFWSNAEMHQAMLARRDSADLDTEWRYHLICVRRLDFTSRGVMYDVGGTDSNNVPREGAGIASHWTIPNSDPWGTVKGQRFGAADAPYFRTAVHEIGHAMGLYHNTADTGFMNTTGVIAASPGTFPANIQWSFNGADARRLRHMPDPWVRPGMIPFGDPYGSAPISPADMMDLGEAMELKVELLLDSVPIGAPVRIRVTLTNRSDATLDAPETLSLKSEHVSGRVVDPSGARRSFRSLVRCIEEHEHKPLKPGDSLAADITLLRGAEGALFPAPGLHRVEVDVAWEMNGMPVRVGAGAPVMVTPPADDSHARAAMATLSAPDLLLTLALGGDHLEDGVGALRAAMADKTLAPHFAVVEAKRIGRRFGRRAANPKAAVEAIPDNAVMTPSEVRHVAKLAKEVGGSDLKKVGKKAGLKSLMGGMPPGMGGQMPPGFDQAAGDLLKGNAPKGASLPGLGGPGASGGLPGLPGGKPKK